MSFDAIIIGSGFGGAVAAYRLAEAGARVLVLERGRRWSPQTLPRKAGDAWFWSHRSPEARNGWIDLRRFRHMTVAQGAAVGGGSHIYANVSTLAPRRSFDSGWPSEISFDELKPHYDAVAAMMDVQPVPEAQFTKRMQLMRDAAERGGYAERFRALDLAVSFDKDWTYANDYDGKTDEERAAASKPFFNRHGARQGTCVHLGTCDIGCKVSARNTLDLNYLYVAENKYGAEVRPLHLVDRIEPEGAGWRVSFDRLETGQRVPGSEVAGLLVIAAGSLGSTELLLRNRNIHRTLPAISGHLGQGWSSNGDFLTPAFYPNRTINASEGPTIGSIIDFEDGSEGGQFWIQDGGVPDLLMAYLETKAKDPATGFRTKLLLESADRVLRADEPLARLMPWFAQGVDAGNGRLHLTSPSLFSAGGDLDLEWDVTASAPIIETIIAMHKKLSALTGGDPIVPPTWSLLKDLVTPHPLGGCCMGQDAEHGVVDHRGAVFGYANLFVLDGAIIPRPLGVNPSRTIAALAERCSSLIVGSRDWGRA